MLFFIFSSGEQVPRFHLALTLDRDLTDIFTFEFIPDQLVGVAGDLDFTAFAVAFHAAGGIDHITPQRIEVFLATNNACDQWAGVQADADLNRMLASQELLSFDIVQHIERQPGQDLRVIRAWGRDSSRDHVSIAGHLDLFHAVFIYELVKMGE